MRPEDADLLRDYVLNRSQEAFAEIVRRHLNLVYSAASRYVRSPVIAQDVAQLVFIDLARSAGRLKSGTPLVAWLYLVTRRTAIDTIRKESRRYSREQTASEISAMDSSSSLWPQIEPILDEALEALPSADRNAVLLRYFESKSLREVGESLGISDDAAQKRVSRALEQLRKIFVTRGIGVSAAGLVANLSAHAMITAPVALGASVLSVATLVSQASNSAAATTLAMTITQKIAVSTALTLLVGFSAYEAKVVSRVQNENHALQQRFDALAREADHLRAERQVTTRRLAEVEKELTTTRSISGDPAAESALEDWLGRVKTLKQRLSEMPEKSIPEMQYLTDEDWLNVTHRFKKFSTEFEVREALSFLRNMAQNHVAEPMRNALAEYLKAHDGQLPRVANELAPYLDRSIDPAVLHRYEMLRGGRVSDVPRGEWVLRARPVDDYQDTLLMLGTEGGYGFIGGSAGQEAAREAVKSFRAANSGRAPVDAAQLTPYLKRTVETAILQKYLTEIAVSNSPR
jgi:RNA polymerase sigma factor (sigma-70 family)